MVEVERLALVERPVAEVDVVRVELDERQVVLLAGELGEALGDGRLARRRAAGDADQERSRRQGVHGAATLPSGLVSGRRDARPQRGSTTTMPT